MKKAIFFTHHEPNEMCETRFKNSKRLNKDWDVYAIGFPGNLLPGSIVVDRSLFPSNESMPIVNKDWSQADIFAYQAFLSFPNYDFYFLLEYDTAFNTSISDFFSDITEHEYSGNEDENFNMKHWQWYQMHSKSKNAFEDQFYGCSGVTTCLGFKREILEKITKEVIENKTRYRNMYSEIRLGTLIKKYTRLRKSRPNLKEYISYDPRMIEVKEEGKYFYHPVKNLLESEILIGR